jgi:hypothetical protein
MAGDLDLATLEGRANPRFVVTSLSSDQHQARALYEKLYCARGEMENRIKECQLDLFAVRTSTHTMRANQLRLWLSSMAYVLVSALRRIALVTTRFADATCGTIRLKLQDRRPGPHQRAQDQVLDGIGIPLHRRLSNSIRRARRRGALNPSAHRRPSHGMI